MKNKELKEEMSKSILDNQDDLKDLKLERIPYMLEFKCDDCNKSTFPKIKNEGNNDGRFVSLCCNSNITFFIKEDINEEEMAVKYREILVPPILEISEE